MRTAAAVLLSTCAAHSVWAHNPRETPTKMAAPRPLSFKCQALDTTDSFVCGGEEGTASQLTLFESRAMLLSLKDVVKTLTSSEQGPKEKELGARDRQQFTSTYELLGQGAGGGGVVRHSNYERDWWQVWAMGGLIRAKLKLVGKTEYILAGYNSAREAITWVQCGQFPTWALDTESSETCSLVVRKMKGDALLEGANHMAPGSVAVFGPEGGATQWYELLKAFSLREKDPSQFMNKREKVPDASRIVEDENRLVYVSANQRAVVSCEHPSSTANSTCQVRVY